MTQRSAGTADLYLRLSLDREGKTAIERQDADCTEWCTRNGLDIRTRHTDRGRSGYKNVERKGFDAAVKAVTSGEVSTLVVWKLDRLSRRGVGQVGEVLDRLERVGGRIVFVMDGLDTSQPQSRVVIAMLSELARSESVNISTRVKSAKAHLRTSGSWLGGKPPYGLRTTESGTLEHDPDTVPVMRRLVDGYLNGTTMVHLARELNQEKVAPSRGSQWTVGTISQLLKSPTLAGMLPKTLTREHPDSGEKIYTGDVVPYRDPATGETVSICEPVITAAERQKILDTIAERTNHTFSGRRPRRKARALLTGLAFCECGARMSRSGDSYVCGSARNGGSCSGARVLCSALDKHIGTVWRSKLSAATENPDDPFLLAVARRWADRQDPGDRARYRELETEIADQRARLADLRAARYEREEFSGPDGRLQYEQLHARMVSRLETMQREQANLSGALDIGGFMEPELVLEAWEAHEDDTDTRRELLRLGFERVTVKRAKGRGYRFNPDERVTITTVEQ